MEQATQRYKRSLSGSIGAGMKSVFGGEGRRYYTLVHKVSSKYHKAGEAQKIIVDQIELGRDPRCQVRFDESFATVSRRHAAIVKDGENWKLVQLSKTNTTYLNGHPVEKEWYLQNGDEIQLSTNGPKLGFIIPEGKSGLVKSIGLTARLNLFRQQALRPYKQAIAAIVALFVVGATVSGVMISGLKDEVGTLTGLLAETQQKLDSLKHSNSEMSVLIKEQEERNRRQQAQISQLKKQVAQSADVPDLVKSVRSSVYFIVTTVYCKEGNRTYKVGSGCGTGFLLTDGRFVTARHCVESWLFNNTKVNTANETYSYFSVWSEITAYGVNNDSFTLRSSDFTIDRSKDLILSVGTDDNGNAMKMRLAYYFEAKDINTGEIHKYGDQSMWSTDWACARTNKHGMIEPDAELSSSLAQGSVVHVLGFPEGLGVNDGKNRVEPIYNKMNVARNGLNKAGCIMVSQGVAHGNSGGPVFYVKDGKLKAVAIVSRLESATQKTDASGSVIIQQQQQYDELVPIKNIR